MVKKIVIALLLMMLPLSAMAAENRVFDNCDLFSAEEEAQIQLMIEQLKEILEQNDSDTAGIEAVIEAAE